MKTFAQDQKTAQQINKDIKELNEMEADFKRTDKRDRIALFIIIGALLLTAVMT